MTGSHGRFHEGAGMLLSCSCTHRLYTWNSIRNAAPRDGNDGGVGRGKTRMGPTARSCFPPHSITFLPPESPIPPRINAT